MLRLNARKTLFVTLLLSAFVALLFVANGQAQSKLDAKTNMNVHGTPQSITLETPTGKLFGTLEVPANAKGKMPVALIIAGSGATDRNGNIQGLTPNNAYKMLAETLAQKGVASLRYDKRGIAESVAAGGRKEDLRFDTLIDDAVAWSNLLRGDKRFSRLVIIGHSEGSLVGMVAANKLKADAFVSLAGAGKSLADTVRAQMKSAIAAGRATPKIEAEAEALTKAMLEGKRVENVPPYLMALYRPSVQPYIISLYRYRPTDEMKKLTAPVLILQGTTDIQITAEDARLLAAANPKAKLVLIEGMNHVLKTVPADEAKQMASYGDPNLPLASQLVIEIENFLKANNIK